MATTLTYEQRLAAGAAAKAAALKEQQAALAKTAPTATTTKPSPTSVTGLPKTNANTNISGSIKPVTQTTTPSDGSWISGVKPATTTPTATPAKTIQASPTNPAGTPQTPLSSGEWINGPAKTTTTTTPLPSSTGLNETKTAAAPTTGTPTGQATTTIPAEDQGTETMKAATAEYVEGQNAIVGDLKSQMASDIALIQADADARMAELEKAKDVLNTLHEQNLSAIESATAAAQVANDNALKKQEAAVKNAQAAVDQKYLELKAAQQLENKRAEVRKETALGVLGGTFSTAGVADIEETIMQGEQALNSLGLSNIATNKEYNDQLTQFYDDYRQKNLEIQSYKMDKINESYKNLQDSIAAIQAQENTSEEDKMTQILNAGRYYNSQITAINGQVVQAKYDLANNVIARADALNAQTKAEAKDAVTAANLERDDARAAIQNIITTYPADALANMTDEQKAQLQALEVKAGYPEGLVASGIASMKETLNDAKINQMNISNDQKQQLINLKEKTAGKINTFTDSDGVVTVVITNPITGTASTIPLGEIGKADSPYQPVVDESGKIVGFNKNTGTTTPAPGGTGVEGGGVKGDVGDALDVPNGTSGGECGHFVNDYLGKRIMTDLYKDKLAQTNSKTPAVGAVFVMPTDTVNGHTGFVKEVGTNPNTGKPGILAKDSNWSKDGKVKEHWIDQNKITGYVTTGASVSGSKETSSYKPEAVPSFTENPWGAISATLKNMSNTQVAGLTRTQLINNLVNTSQVAGITVDKKVLNSMSDNDLRAELLKRISAAKTATEGKEATTKTKVTNATSWEDQINNLSF